MNHHTTEELRRMLSSADSVSALKDYTDMAKEDRGYDSYAAWLKDRLQQAGIVPADLFRRAGIQMNYGYQILSGMKRPGRDKVIALALALGCPVEDGQRALTLAGKAVLYPRSRRDSILIFCMQRKATVDEANELLYEMGEEILH